MIKLTWAICYLGAMGMAMKLIEQIPDQIVLQDTEFALDVAPYFSEPPSEFHIEYPDFLSFSSRKLTAKEIFRLHYDEPPPWAFTAAVEVNRTGVLLLMKELGVLIYELDGVKGARLVQHYFEDCICKNYTSISTHPPILALYNSSELVLIDISSKQFPSFLLRCQFPSTLLRVHPLSSSQLLILTQHSGLQLVDFDAEGGLSVTQSLDEYLVNAPPSVASTPSAIQDFVLTTAHQLFVIDTVLGLRSVTFPSMTGVRWYSVLGKSLVVSNGSVWVDGRVEVVIATGEVRATPVPIDSGLFAFAKGYFFYHNETHLLVFDPRTSITYVEEGEDLRDLKTINDSYILTVRSGSAVIRSFSAERTVIHGHAPNQNGAFDVLFVARSSSDSIEIAFTLMVESPPLKVLLFLLIGTAIVGGTIGLGYLVFRLIMEGKKRQIAEIHMLTEEYTSGTPLPRQSASQLPRQLGPTPNVERNES